MKDLLVARMRVVDFEFWISEVFECFIRSFILSKFHFVYCSNHNSMKIVNIYNKLIVSTKFNVCIYVFGPLYC